MSSESLKPNSMLNHIKYFSLEQLYMMKENMLYGDKNSPMVRGTKPKNGTCWAYEHADVNLALIKEDDEMHGYITGTNLSAEAAEAYYSKRWGIETDNRVMEQFRAMRNLWVLANLVASVQIYGKQRNFLSETLEDDMHISQSTARLKTEVKFSKYLPRNKAFKYGSIKAR